MDIVQNITKLATKNICPKLRYQYAFLSGAGQICRLGCKARNCDACGKYWSTKWRAILNEYHISHKTPTLALGLTTSYDCGSYKLWRALKYFWRLIRAEYPKVEYFGVVEFNQAHTQPHLHFCVVGYDFIRYQYIRTCWQQAQRWAGFNSIAWNTRIEEIKKGIAAYFTKYITKATGSKDEIPTKEEWNGRYVRYSRKFFMIPAQTLFLAWKFNRQTASGNFPTIYTTFEPNKQLSLLPFIFWSFERQKKLKEFLNRPWDYQSDRENATIDGEQLKMFNVLRGTSSYGGIYYERKRVYRMGNNIAFVAVGDTYKVRYLKTS